LKGIFNEKAEKTKVVMAKKKVQFQDVQILWNQAYLEYIE